MTSKVWRVIKLYFMPIFKIPFVFLILLSVVIVKPFWEIRLIPLFSSRIGHYLGNTIIIFADLQINHNNKYLDLWFENPPISNSFASQMIRRHVKVHSGFFLSPAFYIMSKYKFFKKNIYVKFDTDRDVNDYLRNFKRPNFIKSSEKFEGFRILEKMGIPKESEIVLFHARDSKYLANTFPEADYSYHNYRDSDINNYLPATEYLAKMGIYSIRMGKIVEKPIHTKSNYVFDYANSKYRSDFMDMFLGSVCKFFISSGTGIDAVTDFFNKPNLWVNYPNITYPKIWKYDHFIIFKKLFDSRTNCKLSMNELYDRDIENAWSTKDFISRNIILKENSEYEILESVKDFNLFLDGKLNLAETDLELQKLFWRNFKRIKKLHGDIPFRAKIAPSFLRENTHLFSNL